MLLSLSKRVFLCAFLLAFQSVLATDTKNQLKDSIQKYIYNNPALAKKYIHRYLSISEKQKEDNDVIIAYNYLGYVCMTLSETDSAFYFCDKAIIKAYGANNQNLVLRAKINKASLLYQTYNFEQALLLYNEALQLANKLKDSYSVRSISISIANIKYEIGKHSEALAVFKRYLNSDISKPELASLELKIAKAYLKMNQPDSSMIYIKKGLEYCKQANDKELEVYFLNVKGLSYLKKKNYNQTEQILNDALQKSVKIKNKRIEATVMLSLAGLMSEQKEYNKSNQILKSGLSKQDKSEFAPEELTDYYKLLAENYKAVDSIGQSNFYYQKFIDENSKKSAKKIGTIEDLHKIDLEKIDQEKTDEVKQKNILIVAVLLLIGFLGFFYFRSKRNDRVNQEKFDILIGKINDFEAKKLLEEQEKPEKSPSKEEILESQLIPNITISKEEDIIEPEEADKMSEMPEIKEVAFESEEGEELIEDVVPADGTFIIKDERVNDILEKLEKLQEKKYFLRQDCTLHSVAKKLKTNTAYLSKIVNNELGKSFSTYINELRINYVILELKNNSKLRAYSVSSIADEIGYKSSDSFTKYFKAATGITPSIYIKKIEEMKHKEESVL
ncbi:helix-turn-helix domain-containing protein [Flavobacterium cerinum]|uniref:Tetratricopeptide repeat protein n=1 Tax=Flavobacterium cerinum TaxID=2502784 RepID=A0ABY5IU75_9FLAO|nr:helix-turn-helix domain-containing protein [Flavobacterium cerinum]UUC46214.1 tetratricopeptide repeat protein [Flavobacterium cerinum]